MSPQAGCGSLVRELRILLNKAQKWIIEALPDIRSGFPFPLLGLDSDNSSEFINHTLRSWCDANRITFTRAGWP